MDYLYQSLRQVQIWVSSDIQLYYGFPLTHLSGTSEKKSVHTLGLPIYTNKMAAKAPEPLVQIQNNFINISKNIAARDKNRFVFNHHLLMSQDSGE